MNHGETINDERYTGKNIFSYTLNTMPYSLNVDWEAPKYNPFALDELVLVHLTDQEASDGILKPQSYAPVKITNHKSKVETEWFFPRETLHFTLNGFVDEHRGGCIQEHIFSWANKKFAYIVPLSDVIPQVISLFTHDTIVLGKILLPDSAQIISNQSPEKILSAIKEKGYRTFDIRGVKQLDPAFLEGTNINVNHPANFSEILDTYKIDSAYTSPSINNILWLDGCLGHVFATAGYNMSLIESYEMMTDEISKRMEYFKERHKINPALAEPLARLEFGTVKYIKFIQDLKALDEKASELYASVKNDSYEAHEEVRNKVNCERAIINEQLLWKNK
jgi:hypothetical protein